LLGVLLKANVKCRDDLVKSGLAKQVQGLSKIDNLTQEDARKVIKIWKT